MPAIFKVVPYLVTMQITLATHAFDLDDTLLYHLLYHAASGHNTIVIMQRHFTTAGRHHTLDASSFLMEYVFLKRSAWHLILIDIILYIY